MAHFLVVAIVMLLLKSPAGYVAASDVDSLLALKAGFNDPKELASWNKGNDLALCSGWKGIRCINNTMYVISISLPGSFRGGQISSLIGELPEVQYVDLSGNALVGMIPPQFNQLKNLIILDLSNNLLTGSLPTHWNNLIKLDMLKFERNNLTGSIPSGLSEAVALQWLRVEHNGLSGNIPSQITTLHKLRYLAVEYNNLSGPIPQDIGRLASLHSFYAAHNQLNDSIPESISNLTVLLHFDVEHNNLSGSIPPSLGNFTQSLVTLNLSGNNLEGQIPQVLSKFPSSSFANNLDLCGPPLPGNCSPSNPPGSSVPPPPYFYEARPPGKSMSPGNIRSPPQQDHHRSHNIVRIVGGVVGGLAGAFVVLIFAVILARRSLRRKENAQIRNWFSRVKETTATEKGRFAMFEAGFRYEYEEIVSHAGHYDTAHVVGKGRFATVYRADFPDGTQMAVKVFNSVTNSTSFEQDIEILASMKHRHLLPIRGFYSSPVETAIFYIYLPNRTLDDLLHSPGQNSLALPDWAARQRIALGVAQALTYLHRGNAIRIVHKSVKSSNILLDTDTLIPRLSDYGLLSLASNSAVVKTPGYTAPEVAEAKTYSMKSDVYSYGVVLLELITGKRAVSNIGEKALNLTDWASRLHREGRGREVMDSMAFKTCPIAEKLDRTLNLAVLCVDSNPNVRPTMSEIVALLEDLSAAERAPVGSPEMRCERPLLPCGGI